MSNVTTANKGPISRFLQNLFMLVGADKGTKLVLDNCVDSEGRLRMYHPAVQTAIYAAIKTDLVKLLEQEEKDAKTDKKA